MTPPAPARSPAAAAVLPAPPVESGVAWARRPPRRALWGMLLALLLVAQSLLLWLTHRHENMREQERADEFAAAAATALRQQAQQLMQSLQALPPPLRSEADWSAEAIRVMSAQRALARLEWRDERGRVLLETGTPWRGPVFDHWPRTDMNALTETACAHARGGAGPTFSRSHYVPQGGGAGLELVDLCVPIVAGARLAGEVVGTIVLADWLDQAFPGSGRERYELSFVEPDGARLARAGSARGAGIFQTERVVDLAGAPLLLRADSVRGRPSLVANLPTALVLGLSLALLALVLLLARDVRRRARAEAALAEALALRRAMEDSLNTGLRARDRAGRITYANPAFCKMVGVDAETLYRSTTPPYWPPELAATYERRQAERLAAGTDQPAREGFETQFVRADGERFPVLIYEAPLVDGQGRHTGWMSAVLDITEQRRAEALARAQQDKLAASARLASMGEMASLISHELNQPLAAIASYATGSLNLIEPGAAPAAPQLPLLADGLRRIAEQAERAGRVIRSVQDFVRRRDPVRLPVQPQALLEVVVPLVDLQARRLGAELHIDMPADLPRIEADRTMIEQVLLNLARNGLQAMEALPAGAPRRLVLRLRGERGGVRFEVEDSGPGIPPEIAQQLYTPFFTTRREGLGLGLSLCRTVIEQHGGHLAFAAAAPQAAHPGTTFGFTLRMADLAA